MAKNNKLLLDEVLQLGGSEEDFKMLANVEDDQDAVKEFHATDISDKVPLRNLHLTKETFERTQVSREHDEI